VQANLLAATAPAAAGNTMNIGTGVSVTLNQVIAELQRQLGTTITPNYQPGRQGDVRESLADITAARALLNYEPSVSFADGLAQTVASFAHNGAVKA
jgi:UDP-glucose 4-epimerase